MCEYPMSIAICAVIAPSRLLRWALALHAMAGLGASIALLSGWGDNFHFSHGIALACAMAALLAGRASLRQPTVRQLDISGLGELRLTVQQSLGSAPAQARSVHLAPGSTLWPGLLLLQLRGAAPGHTVLLIVPGCVAPGQFRKLAVSIRTIARRDNKFVEKNKIL